MAWYDDITLRVLTWGGLITPKGSQLTKEEADTNIETILTKLDSIGGTAPGTQPPTIPNFVLGDVVFPDQTVYDSEFGYYTNISGATQQNVSPPDNPAIYAPVDPTQIFISTPIWVQITNSDLTVEGDHLVYTWQHNRNTLNYHLIVRGGDGFLINCQNIPFDENSCKIYIDDDAVALYKLILY